MFKANLRNSGLATCDKAYRSGTWVSKPCTIDVVSDAIDYMPKQRWEKMDCDHAWSDTMTRWFGCDKPSKNGTFSNSVANFVHAQERAACNDLSTDVNCDSSENCYAHNSPDDSDNAKTGACGYEIWNSLVAIHQVSFLNLMIWVLPTPHSHSLTPILPCPYTPLPLHSPTST